MKTDSIYLAIFCLVQLFLFSTVGSHLFPESFTSLNSVVWAVFCGVGFGCYPWLRPFHKVTPRLYLASVCVHLLAILVLSTVVTMTILGNNSGDWPTTFFLMTVPAALGGFIVLLFSYARFCHLRHA